MEKNVERVYISAEEIQERVTQLGQEISEFYPADEEIVVIGVLNGSFCFMADLVRKIKQPAIIEFFGCSSYGSGTESTGNLRITKDLDRDIADKHVLVVEDIVDTGTTLARLRTFLSKRNPKSIRIVALVDKPSRRKVETPVDFVGFEIEDYFVVGYGMDFADHYRNLPYIGVLKPEAYESTEN
ncbi:MAG: hypoxanthine phosphoribosyltransferase [Firmicutes bacterium]|nr:hypoxanthine phosphoribosyltransferase [Bacillota bacterium]